MMPLFIRDPEVDALAIEVQKLTRASTKTEAVKAALANELQRVSTGMRISQRLAKAKHIADAMGPSDRAFNMKAFTDEMWENL